MADYAPRSMRVLMGFVLAKQGEEDVANRAFDDTLEAAEVAFAKGSTYYGRALDVASIHAYRGDREAALRELQRAYDLGYRANFALAVDPFFASLREEPSFKTLLNRMAESQREQREVARQTGALKGYDNLMSAGPTVTAQTAAAPSSTTDQVQSVIIGVRATFYRCIPGTPYRWIRATAYGARCFWLRNLSNSGPHPNLLLQKHKTRHAAGLYFW
jgi:hypothetical protein